MNWDAIGAIGELVGAAAVVVTLIYLSFQMRLARQATAVQSRYSVVEIYGNWRSHLIGNERLVSVVAKANRGDEITPEEDIQLANLMDDLCVALASSQPAAQSISLYGSSAEIDYLEYVLDQNPGLAPYLPRIHRYLSGAVPDFAKAMEPLMARRGVGTS